MKMYYIDIDRKKRNTAGAKAPNDIAELCRRKGYQRIAFPSILKNNSKIVVFIWTAIVCILNWIKILLTCERNSIIIIQHPMYGRKYASFFISQIKKIKKINFIVIIHDLESLRGGISGIIQSNKKAYKFGDEVYLKQFDAIICHNDYMKEYMISKGFDAKKLVCLEIFDYLTDGGYAITEYKENPSVVIAGNLAYGKCKYIYSIVDKYHNTNINVELFGVHFEEDKATRNMNWHGSFSPEELAEHIRGTFGIVWDGETAYTCTGNTGEYLRYNNPHKTSLYLAAGMPVIVWKQAAIADFVNKHKVGVLVDSLLDIETVIKDMNIDDYNSMRKEAMKISQRLRSGFYFYHALEHAIEVIMQIDCNEI